MSSSNFHNGKPRMRTLDLFCGAGGSSYGAHQAGAEIVAALDYWQTAVDTYNANFGEGKARCANIFDFDVEALKKEIGGIDLILASPECTNHSKAKGNGIRCERSKETALEVVHFARVFKPQWIVVENVEEMQDWPRHQELKRKLEELGYNCSEVKLNAQNFGVPQSRKRLFMLCSLLNVPEEPNSLQQKTPKAQDIIVGEKYRLNPLRSEKRAKATLAKADYAIEQMQQTGEGLQPFLIVYYGSAKAGGNGGWQKLDRPLRTITTLDRFGYVVPGETREQDRMRMLQPDELRRAMGYDDKFKFAEGITRRDKIKLMGNGVCPPVMKAIVESLIEQPKKNGAQGDS
jgi:DNA (cytosine-5)-methyltransferase 1